MGGAGSGAHTTQTLTRAPHQTKRHRFEQKEEGSGGVKVVSEEAEGGPLMLTDLARANV